MGTKLIFSWTKTFAAVKVRGNLGKGEIRMHTLLTGQEPERRSVDSEGGVASVAERW